MSKAKPHSRPGECRVAWLRPLLALFGCAVVLAATVGATDVAPALARITSVSAITVGGARTVVIETTEPVPYVHGQPDPLTFVVDLRNATAGGVRSAIGRQVGPVADVSVEDARGEDGVAIARVRLALANPATPTVRSRRQKIFVEFGDTQSNGATIVPAPVRATKAQASAPAPVGARPARSTGEPLTLKNVHITSTPFGTLVTVSGTGTLGPTTAEPTTDDPPRLVLDFRGVTATAQTVTGPADGPVARVRVAQHTRQPLVARVVIDLRQRAPFRVEPVGGQVIVILESDVTPPASPVDATSSAGFSKLPAATVPASAAAVPAATPTAAATTSPMAPTRAATVPAPAAVATAPAPSVAPPRAATVPTPAAVAAAPAPSVAPPRAATVPAPAAVATAPAPSVAVPATTRAPSATPSRDGAQPVPVATPKDSEPVVITPTAVPAKTQKPATPPTDAGALSASSQNLLPAEQPKRQYTGNPVTFDFAQTDLRSVLRLFSEISGLNVVIDPAIAGTVDVSLREVPWDQALEIILRANKLGYIIENNVVRIASLTALADEEKDRRKLADEQALSGTLRVLTRSLSYAKAADLSALLLKSALSARGQVQVDTRTNTIIMTDLPASLANADALITALDKAEPQVEIEARIVQITRTSARELGVLWGMKGRMASELGNTSPLRFPATGTLTGASGPTSLQEAAPSGTVGLSMGTLDGAFKLDAALSALEKKGQGKVLSTPRVMMQNHIEAEMTQGVQIPVTTPATANSPATTMWKDVALTLRVTPQITAANTVIMEIFLENATPDYSRIIEGKPPIDTQRAKTQVLVGDGETTVIGGIVVQRETSANNHVPMLSRIPLLGWLFKHDLTKDENNELLIFITPRISRQ